MRKLTLIFFLLLLNLGFAQTESEDIKVVFDRFKNLIETEDYDKGFDFYYKGFFKIAPKSKLIKDYEELNNDENYEYFVNISKIISISKIVKKNNTQYALFKYGVTTHFKFNDKSDKVLIELIKQNVENSYGETYSFSESNNQIIYYEEQEMIGITDNNWKFFPYTESLHSFIRTLVPNEVLNQILSERK